MGDAPNQTLDTIEEAKRYQLSSGAVYFLLPTGMNPCCGFVCCPPKGMITVADPSMSKQSVSAYMNEQELDSFIAEINETLNDTLAPPCPCVLIPVVGCCYACVSSHRQNSRIGKVLENMNSKLRSKQVEWRKRTCKVDSTGCGLVGGLMFSLHLLSKTQQMSDVIAR
jgi:hypothetical protein